MISFCKFSLRQFNRYQLQRHEAVLYIPVQHSTYCSVIQELDTAIINFILIPLLFHIPVDNLPSSLRSTKEQRAS